MTLEASLKAASLLLALQLLSRLVTFALNHLLLAHTSPAAYGTATIQLEPLLNSILFFSREGIRSALARSHSPDTQLAINTSYLSLAAGVPISVIVSTAYLALSSKQTTAQHYFVPTVAIYALAALLELAAEPCFNKAQSSRNTKLRVNIEGSAVIARALVTLLAIIRGGSHTALLAFALGQLAYALVVFSRYAFSHCMSQDTASLVPRPIHHKEQTQWFDRPSMSLAFALTKQSFFKQILTEGDKLAVATFSPLEDQGSYALALNYGSLLARIVFQPIEESSRLFYSQTLTNPTPANIESSQSLLILVLKFQLYLTLILTCFAPAYVTPFLSLLLPSSWRQTNAFSLLNSYLYVLPFLGINGVTEAFVQAVSTPSQLSAQSKALVTSTAIYVGTVWLASFSDTLKEYAIMVAAATSMTFRIAYSYYFSSRYFERVTSSWSPKQKAEFRKKWRQCVPSMKVIGLFMGAKMAVNWSEKAFDTARVSGLAKHVGLGGVLGLLCLSIIAYDERQSIRTYLNSRKPKPTD